MAVLAIGSRPPLLASQRRHARHGSHRSTLRRDYWRNGDLQSWQPSRIRYRPANRRETFRRTIPTFPGPSQWIRPTFNRFSRLPFQSIGRSAPPSSLHTYRIRRRQAAHRMAMARRQDNKRGRRGYTLVETLVAMMMFALISAATTFALNVAIRGQRAAQRKADEIQEARTVLSMLSRDFAGHMRRRRIRTPSSSRPVQIQRRASHSRR